MIGSKAQLVFRQAALSVGTQYHGSAAWSLLHRLWLQSKIFWLPFCTGRGSGDLPSIFIDAHGLTRMMRVATLKQQYPQKPSSRAEISQKQLQTDKNPQL